MSQKHIVVIGGSAAGPKTAAKARRMDQEAKITLLQKDPDLSMASCGYPYYVGGTFDNRNSLLCSPTGVVRDPKFFVSTKGIEALTSTEATRIDRQAKKVFYRNLISGETSEIAYDKLVIATGATPSLPPIPGIKLKGITTLQSMHDADFLRTVRDEGKIKKAVVVGGGLIGIETCEALQLAGIKVTVVEMLPQILKFLDLQLAKLMENHVRSKNSDIITGNGVAEFLGEDGQLCGVKLQSGTELPCELAVIAIGVRPNVRLAKEAGITIGETGGIQVNEYMQTSDPDIYSVGDCVQIPHRITGKPTLAPFGDLANLQGRVVGQNLVLGNCETFPGTVKTGVCKVFDFTAGSTGLTEDDARAAGFENVISTICAGPDIPHFMKGKLLISKLVADQKTGQILGYQCVGPGDASKRIATAAMAIQGKMTVQDLCTADLPYAPPFSLAIDHLIACAHVLDNKMKNYMNSMSAMEMKKRVDHGDTSVFYLDVRGPDEFEAMRLGIGETLIPLSALRNRLHELPQDKDREIICYCKISLRGYEAASLLKAKGWKNVKVLEGGIMAWPFPREK